MFNFLQTFVFWEQEQPLAGLPCSRRHADRKEVEVAKETSCLGCKLSEICAVLLVSLLSFVGFVWIYQNAINKHTLAHHNCFSISLNKLYMFGLSNKPPRASACTEMKPPSV